MATITLFKPNALKIRNIKIQIKLQLIKSTTDIISIKRFAAQSANNKNYNYQLIIFYTVPSTQNPSLAENLASVEERNQDQSPNLLF